MQTGTRNLYVSFRAERRFCREEDRAQATVRCGFGSASLESKDSAPSLVCALKKEANHGWGALALLAANLVKPAVAGRCPPASASSGYEIRRPNRADNL